MEQMNTCLTKGLTSYQIKILAAVFMTIDHLGAYGFEIPIFSIYNNQLRLIGRLAMPLFLFCLTDSIRYSRSRPKFLLRLYLGAVGVGLFVTVTNYLFGDSVGSFIQSNILYDYLYVALYVTLLEGLISGVREKDKRKLLGNVAGLFGTCIPHCIWKLYAGISFMDHGVDLKHAMMLNDLFGSFVRSPLEVEYSVLFVIMGVAMYFAGNKYAKAAVLVVFSGICYVGGKLYNLIWEIPAMMWVFNTFGLHFVVGYPQYYMILAVPFLLLYNGKKGRSDKWFFYAYYPLHRYAISVAVFLYQLLST